MFDEDVSDLTEVEEQEIEAIARERKFEIGSETDIELEEVENEDSDFTGDREDLVNFLVDLNENHPLEIDLDEDGEPVEEEEISPQFKERDPSEDAAYSGNMRDNTVLFEGEEWQPIED